MLIDPEVRRRAQEVSQTLGFVAQRLFELAGAAGLSSISLPVLLPLSAASAFVGTCTLGVAQMKDRIANDPPRDDFDLATRLNPLRLRPEEGFGSMVDAGAETSVLVEFGLALAEDQRRESAMLRAFERAAGAQAAGASAFVASRLRETRRYRDRTIESLHQLAIHCEVVREIISSLPDDLQSEASQSGRLDDVLPDNVLSILYKSGVTISDVRSVWLEHAPTLPADDLGEALESTAPSLIALADGLANWIPENDVCKVEPRVSLRRFVISKDRRRGGYRWRLVDGGVTVAISERPYRSAQEARAAAERVRAAARGAYVVGSPSPRATDAPVDEVAETTIDEEA